MNSSRPKQQFVKGQTILSEGRVGDRSYKILSGEVIICKKNTAGSLIPITKLGAGEIFGEMYLFDRHKIRTATVVAISQDVTVEIYFQEEIQQMLDNLDPTTLSMFEGLSTRLQRTSERVIETTAQSTKPLSTLPDGKLATPSGVQTNLQDAAPKEGTILRPENP